MVRPIVSGGGGRLLRHSVDVLCLRVHTLVASTPRNDMARIIAENPELMEIAPEEVRARRAPRDRAR